MKTKFNSKKKVAAALAISSLALLSGCGSSQNNAGNNGAVPGAINGYNTGCVPINQTAIPFTASGASLANWVLKAGIIPADSYRTFDPQPQTVGQVILGAAGAPGMAPQPFPGATGGYGQLMAQKADGTTLLVNLQNTGMPTQYPNQYPTAQGAATLTGSLQLGVIAQQQLMQFVYSNGMSGSGQFPTFSQYPTQYPTGYPNGYPNGAPGTNLSSTCITGLAIDLNQREYTNYLYLGSVYLYINGQQHGIALDF